MNFTDARGIRKAQEPIMMGKATVGDIPKAKIKAIQGAYKPTPAVMMAPKKKLTTTANTSLYPVNPVSYTHLTLPTNREV